MGSAAGIAAAAVVVAAATATAVVVIVAAAAAAVPAAAAAAHQDEDQDNPTAATIVTEHERHTSFLEFGGAAGGRPGLLPSNWPILCSGNTIGSPMERSGRRKTAYVTRGKKKLRRKARAAPGAERAPRHPETAEEKGIQPAGYPAVRGFRHRNLHPAGGGGLGGGQRRAGPQQGRALRHHHPARGHLYRERGDGKDRRGHRDRDR